jgi:hypothetical protein
LMRGREVPRKSWLRPGKRLRFGVRVAVCGEYASDLFIPLPVFLILIILKTAVFRDRHSAQSFSGDTPSDCLHSPPSGQRPAWVSVPTSAVGRYASPHRTTASVRMTANARGPRQPRPQSSRITDASPRVVIGIWRPSRLARYLQWPAPSPHGGTDASNSARRRHKRFCRHTAALTTGAIDTMNPADCGADRHLWTASARRKEGQVECAGID